MERLRHRIDVYAREESETEFGETDFEYRKIKTVWAGISVQNVGNLPEDLPGEVRAQRVSHRITVRAGAIEKPRNDMYFMYRGQRYDVEYYSPNYYRNDLIEFYCRLYIETEEDYGGKENYT